MRFASGGRRRRREGRRNLRDRQHHIFPIPVAATGRQAGHIAPSRRLGDWDGVVGETVAVVVSGDVSLDAGQFHPSRHTGPRGRAISALLGPLHLHCELALASRSPASPLQSGGEVPHPKPQPPWRVPATIKANNHWHGSLLYGCTGNRSGVAVVPSSPGPPRPLHSRPAPRWQPEDRRGTEHGRPTTPGRRLLATFDGFSGLSAVVQALSAGGVSFVTAFAATWRPCWPAGTALPRGRAPLPCLWSWTCSAITVRLIYVTSRRPGKASRPAATSAGRQSNAAEQHCNTQQDKQQAVEI